MEFFTNAVSEIFDSDAFKRSAMNVVAILWLTIGLFVLREVYLVFKDHQIQKQREEELKKARARHGSMESGVTDLCSDRTYVHKWKSDWYKQHIRRQEQDCLLLREGET